MTGDGARRLVEPLAVLVLLAAGLVQQFGRDQPPVSRQHQVMHAAVIAAAVLPLLLRRRFPFLVVLVMSTVIAVSGSTGPVLSYDPSPASAFGLLFAAYWVTAVRGRTVGLVAVAVCWTAVTLLLRPWDTPAGAWLPNYPYFLVAYAAGVVQGQRDELAAVLSTRLLDEQTHREARQRLALQQARNGLARDLRDVVVRGLARMQECAGQAHGRLAAGSAGVESALAATETAGRSALAEMRRLLLVLRSDPEPAGPVDDGGAGQLVRRTRSLPVPALLADLLLAAAIAGIALVELQFWQGVLGPVVPPETFSREAHLWAVAWIALLPFRRRWPVPTVLAMSVMAFLQTYPFRYWTPVADIVALQVAVYTVGQQHLRRRYVFGLAGIGAIGLVSYPPPPVTLSPVGFLVITATTLAGVAWIGVVVGDRRSLNQDLEKRLSALTEQRRTALDLAVGSERVALAREMHDLVAHSLTLMVVQAGAARMVAADDPTAAGQAVATVLECGQQAENELQQMVAVLRGDEAPEPVVDPDLPALVARSRASGLEVALDGSGELPEGAVQVFAYRLVQEALTNVRKHAPGSTVEVAVREHADGVEVRVENSGTTASSLSGSGAGHGLIGMQERVDLLGGRLETGPTPRGGFLVRAVLPRELVEA